MKLTFLLPLTLAASVATSNAVITWTAGDQTGADFYDIANWDTSSAIPSPTDDNMVISGVTITENSAAFSGIEIGNGFSLSLDAASFTFINNNGFAGVDDDAATAASTGPTSVLNLSNGSFVSAQFITLGMEVFIDSSSELVLRGGGDPINSQLEVSYIRLSEGGKLTLPTRAEFNEQIADTGAANSIFVNNVAVDASNIDTLFTFATNGSFVTATATAVPEPSTTILAGLAGLGLVLRRRK